MVETTQAQLTSVQNTLLSTGWRIERVEKGKGNARTIYARCVGL